MPEPLYRALPARWRGPRQTEPTLLGLAGGSLLSFAYFAPSWLTFTGMGGTTLVALVVRETRIRGRVRARMAARAVDQQRPDPEPVP